MLKKHLFLCLASAALLTSNFVKSEPLTKHDSHFHLYNYIQKGTSFDDLMTLLSSSGISRTTVFGIPLQQRWNGADDNYWASGGHGHDHDRDTAFHKPAVREFNGRKTEEAGQAPSYYLQTDEELYYFSATDSLIGEFLTHTEPLGGVIFDGMITGINPRDMRALDHIDAMMLAYPGAFKGVGEFTIHKEFVSGKVAGGAATLGDPAFFKTMVGLGERGLIAIVHNDIGNPDSNPAFKYSYFQKLRETFGKITQARGKNKAPIIWAHTGIGRFVDPLPDHPELLKAYFDTHESLYVDLSWNFVAYKILHEFLKDGGNGEAWIDLFKAYPDRFLFGTDSLAPTKVPKEELSEHQSLTQALDGRIGELLKRQDPEDGKPENSEHRFRRLVNEYLRGEGKNSPQNAHQRNANMYGWLWHILEHGSDGSLITYTAVRRSNCRRGSHAKIIVNCIAWANYERLFNDREFRKKRQDHTYALIDQKKRLGDLSVDAKRAKDALLLKLDPPR